MFLFLQRKWTMVTFDGSDPAGEYIVPFDLLLNYSHMNLSCCQENAWMLKY